MNTIGDLCKQFHLSRSTLLYYHKIGLLTSTARTEANYRLYSDEDVKKLEKICLYKKTGLSLKQIKKVLESDHSPTLEQRLDQLNEEFSRIRIQQQLILQMMGSEEGRRGEAFLTADRFEEVLLSMGLNEREVTMFHITMERASGEGHRDFLKFLGLDDESVQRIRTRSREFIEKNTGIP